MRTHNFWVVLSAAIGLLLAFSSVTMCQWEYVALDGTSVRKMVFRPGDSDTAYAIAAGRVHRSIDGGRTWLLAGSIESVTALTVDPVSRDNVYAVCDQAIYRSTDAGGTWTRKDSGFEFSSEYGPTDIEVNPCHPETIYVTTADWVGGGGLYRSADRGDAWSYQDIPWCDNKTCVAVDFVDCGRMFVGVAGEGPLCLSMNSGLSWQSSGLSAVIRDLAINPQGDAVIFAADYSGVLYRSQNGGASWSVVDEGAGLAILAICVAINPVDPQMVFVGGPGGVYRSLDGGDSWGPFNGGLPEGIYVYSVAFDGEFGETAILGSYQRGVFRADCLAGVDTRPSSYEMTALALQSSPNPAQSMATISYRLPVANLTTLSVYNALGQLVMSLFTGYQTAGSYSASWNGRNSLGDPVSPGVYFLRLQSGSQSSVNPVVIFR